MSKVETEGFPLVKPHWLVDEGTVQCVMCSEGENESVEHVMMRCRA